MTKLLSVIQPFVGAAVPVRPIMDREKYTRLVETFFQWDPSAVTSIFEELLSAAAAEKATWGGPSMSQNYETAQANPEIHVLPGNLKDARDAVFPYFWGHR